MKIKEKVKLGGVPEGRRGRKFRLGGRNAGRAVSVAMVAALMPGWPAAAQESGSVAEEAGPAPATAPATAPGTGAEVSTDVGTLDPMVVIGSRDAVFVLPGSGYFVEPEEIRQFNYLNANRVFAKIPGVYVREEDGFGNFPNISIRGGDGTRSEKVTVMEDGILTAPATYSAPSAYYSPNISRMSGVEVLKGSSQVRFGPHTTGGVINYLSTLVPEEQTLYLKSTYGSDNTVLAHGYYGDVAEGEFGRFGYVAELFHKSSDGFRTIQKGNGFGGSDETGFDLIEPMVKLFWEPASENYQRFEFKYGYSQLDADETYVGLSERDLAANPYSRYAGTFLDNILTEHHRTYLKYLVEPADGLTLQVAGYYNYFDRNWYKINSAGGEAIHEILANPHRYSEAFDVLRMRTPGEMNIRANARSYEAYGAQFSTNYDFLTGGLEHALHFGARVHHDSIRQFQRDDTIVVRSGSYFVDRGEPGSGGNRYEEADALSLWIEDKITFGRLSVTPGVRYEHVDLAYTDYASDSTNTRTGGGSGSTSMVAPGVGVTYELTEEQTLFGGVFKGISVPSARSFIREGTDWEESVGYELGLRHQSGGLYAEVAGFFSDFSNLTGSNAGLGALGGGDTTNAGAAEVYGVEFLTSYDLLEGEAVGLPVFVSATYTDATLQTALSSGGGDDILAGGVAGAAIPYIPEWKLAMGVGLDAETWGVDLMATYVSDSFGTARNLDSPIDSAREGKIDGGFTVDLAGRIQISEKLKLVGGIQNVFDEVLTTSRIPDGPRVGAPRQFFAGFELEW